MDQLTTAKKERIKQVIQNIGFALLIGCACLIVYLLGKLITESWGLFSYTFDWVVRSKLFLVSSIIAACPSILGKYRFSCSAFVGICLGMITGDLFGENPAGARFGFGHYGWLIYCVVFFASVLVGVFLEVWYRQKQKKRTKTETTEKS